MHCILPSTSCCQSAGRRGKCSHKFKYARHAQDSSHLPHLHHLSNEQLVIVPSRTTTCYNKTLLPSVHCHFSTLSLAPPHSSYLSAIPSFRLSNPSWDRSTLPHHHHRVPGTRSRGNCNFSLHQPLNMELVRPLLEPIIAQIKSLLKGNKLTMVCGLSGSGEERWKQEW